MFIIYYNIATNGILYTKTLHINFLIYFVQLIIMQKNNFNINKKVPSLAEFN